jgi:hypothetical protein
MIALKATLPSACSAYRLAYDRAVGNAVIEISTSLHTEAPKTSPPMFEMKCLGREGNHANDGRSHVSWALYLEKSPKISCSIILTTNGVVSLATEWTCLPTYSILMLGSEGRCLRDVWSAKATLRTLSVLSASLSLGLIYHDSQIAFWLRRFATRAGC